MWPFVEYQEQYKIKQELLPLYTLANSLFGIIEFMPALQVLTGWFDIRWSERSQLKFLEGKHSDY